MERRLNCVKKDTYDEEILAFIDPLFSFFYFCTFWDNCLKIRCGIFRIITDLSRRLLDKYERYKEDRPFKAL